MKRIVKDSKQTAQTVSAFRTACSCDCNPCAGCSSYGTLYGIRAEIPSTTRFQTTYVKHN